MSATCPLTEVLITSELAQREARPRDVAAEDGALRELLRTLALTPGAVPDVLAALALTRCRAGSAGVSALEGDDVRWVAVAGRLGNVPGFTTRRVASPCGPCLDAGAPQLYRRPERHFTALSGMELEELLVVPFAGAGGVQGTLWVARHADGPAFDGEDARLLASLGEVAAVAQHGADARRARERFLALLNQELRNLLTLVLMNASMVERTVRRSAVEDEGGDVLRWAERTRAAAEVVARVVSDLLDSADLEAGRTRLSRTQVDVLALLREAVSSLAPLALPRQVAVDVVGEGALVLAADAARLRRVVDRLLTVAIELCPAGERVRVRAERTPGEVVLTVEDHGPEGPASAALWIARQLVEAHGGRIRVGDPDGQRFRVSLPA